MLRLFYISIVLFSIQIEYPFRDKMYTTLKMIKVIAYLINERLFLKNFFLLWKLNYHFKILHLSYKLRNLIGRLSYKNL